MPLGFDIHRFRMSVKHGNPDRGGGNPDGMVAENFPGFVYHFHLFFGVPGIQERINVRQCVKRNLVGIHVRLYRPPFQAGFGLLMQFFHRLDPGTGDRLVCGNHKSFDLIFGVDGMERHHHLDGGTVGVGNDVFVPKQSHRIRIHFGYHKRHFRVHAPCAGVVHHHTPGFRCDRGKRFTDISACGKQGQVIAFERILFHLFNRYPLPGKGQFGSGRPARGQQSDIVDGKILLFQAGEHLLAHSPGCARNHYINSFVRHLSSLLFNAFFYKPTSSWFSLSS